MAQVQGIGTCLIPREGGVPCGNQIEDGEPIRTLVLMTGGALVGHKKCVEDYEQRKNEENSVVKRVDQQGPNGPVDMTQAKDGIIGSFPLDQKLDTAAAEAEPERPPAPDQGWGEDVIPVASLPFPTPNPASASPTGVAIREPGEEPNPEVLKDVLRRLALVEEFVHKLSALKLGDDQ
jgi:hypothetical protein